MQPRKFLFAAGGAAAALALVAATQFDRRPANYRATATALLQATPGADRIWAHRVNSLGALNEAKGMFAGVELDLVFNPRSGAFDVTHPPRPSNGLTLERYLSEAADRPNLHFWFDWKNPEVAHLGAALAELDRLDAKYRFRGRTLVETPSDATFPGIDAVSRAGFLHGHYLPTEEGLAALDQGPEAMAQLGATLRTILARGRFGAVTYDARLQPFVDAELDGFLRRHEVRRFSWNPRIDSSDPSVDPRKLSKMTSERRLDALLIAFPSKYRV